MLTGYRHEGGIWCGTGCFCGPIADFEAAVRATHGDSKHGRAYIAAIAFFRAYFGEV